MKRKIVALCMVVALVCGLSLAGFAASSKWPADIVKLELVTNAGYTRNSTMTNTQQIATAKQELEKAPLITVKNVKNLVQKSDWQQIGTIIVTQKNGAQQEKPVYHLLSKTGRVTYILAQGQQYYKLEHPKSRFLTNTFPNIYPYGVIPTATVQNKPLAVIKSDYQYRSIDAGMMAAELPSTAKPKLSLAAGSLPVVFSVEPQSVKVVVGQAGKSVWSGTLSNFTSFVPKAGVTYQVQVTAHYKADDYNGSVIYSMEATFKNTSVFSVENATTVPGEMITLYAKGLPQNSNINVQTNLDFTPQFFSQGNGQYIALLPVSYYTQPGDYSITLQSGAQKKTFPIQVVYKEFPIQDLQVDETTTSSTINSQQANIEFAEKIGAIEHIRDKKSYVTGSKFAWPAKEKGWISTAFGMIRYVNGAPTSYRHDALDIALPQGSFVGATNNGRVVFAGYLQLTGNTVVIEHGYGLKSWYYHMESLNVKEGEMVTRGQQIGRVGSTGFSTGPHLHFGMSVEDVYINPDSFVGKEAYPKP